MPLHRAFEHLRRPKVPTAAQFDGAWCASYNASENAAIKLRAWQRRNGLSTEGAAAALALSVSSYYRQRTGRSPPTAQSIALACYFELHEHDWLAIAELAAALARRTSAMTRSLAAPENESAKLAELPDALVIAPR
jgi:hypothetical protein